MNETQRQLKEYENKQPKKKYTYQHWGRSIWVIGVEDSSGYIIELKRPTILGDGDTFTFPLSFRIVFR